MSRIEGLTNAELSDLGIDARRPSRRVLAVDAAVQGKPLSGAVKAPAYEVSDVFSFQSYFDDAFAERALFRQAPNEQIVASTLSEAIQTAGYGLALTPSSETPVAVTFDTGAQQGKSPVYRLKPGQVIRPQGKADGLPGFFTGFRWGLPFGWLGGGQATLVVLRSPDAAVHWSTDHNEIVYHRIRLQIVDPAAIPAAAGLYTGPLNWPQRFPWPAAMFGVSSLTQRGQPAFGVMPTRTALSLRLATLVNPSDMRMYFVGSDPWAQTGPISAAQQVGTISLADVRATDITWGSWAQQAGAPAPFSSAFPTLILTGEAERYAANAGAVVLASAVVALQGAYVDFVRWGRL